MIRLKPDGSLRTEKIRINARKALILHPKDQKEPGPGVLWIHGGGYFLGMKEMVYAGRAENLARSFGCTVISPDYRLAWLHPYPAALEDCYQALLYMRDHAKELNIRSDQLMVGGESAGGGLAAAVCILARDRGEVNVAFQMPLYPMISNRDTESSKNNHGRIWNTRRNHLGWRLYLRKNAREHVSPRASPAGLNDFAGLPPAYSFVGDGEPFYAETLAYIAKLQKAGIPAACSVYHTDMHAFDMLQPTLPESKKAIASFEKAFAFAKDRYFSPQK